MRPSSGLDSAVAQEVKEDVQRFLYQHYPHGVPIREFRDMFEEEIGYHINVTKFNCIDLDDFFKQMPQVAKVQHVPEENTYRVYSVGTPPVLTPKFEPDYHTKMSAEQSNSVLAGREAQRWSHRMKPNADGLYVLTCPIHTGTDQNDVLAIFCSYGHVERVIINSGGRSAVIQFKDKNEAVVALVELAATQDVRIAEECYDPEGERHMPPAKNQPKLQSCSLLRPKVAGKEVAELYVGNIHRDATEKELEEVFSTFNISHWKIYKQGSNKYAFLQVKTLEEAHEIIKVMDKQHLKGRPLKVSLSRNTELEILKQKLRADGPHAALKDEEFKKLHIVQEGSGKSLPMPWEEEEDMENLDKLMLYIDKLRSGEEEEATKLLIDEDDLDIERELSRPRPRRFGRGNRNSGDGGHSVASDTENSYTSTRRYGKRTTDTESEYSSTRRYGARTVENKDSEYNGTHRYGARAVDSADSDVTGLGSSARRRGLDNTDMSDGSSSSSSRRYGSTRNGPDDIPLGQGNESNSTLSSRRFDSNLEITTDSDTLGPLNPRRGLDGVESETSPTRRWGGRNRNKSEEERFSIGSEDGAVGGVSTSPGFSGATAGYSNRTEGDGRTSILDRSSDEFGGARRRQYTDQRDTTSAAANGTSVGSFGENTGARSKWSARHTDPVSPAVAGGADKKLTTNLAESENWDKLLIASDENLYVLSVPTAEGASQESVYNTFSAYGMVIEVMMKISRALVKFMLKEDALNALKKTAVKDGVSIASESKDYSISKPSYRTTESAALGTDHNAVGTSDRYRERNASEPTARPSYLQSESAETSSRLSYKSRTNNTSTEVVSPRPEAPSSVFGASAAARADPSNPSDLDMWKFRKALKEPGIGITSPLITSPDMPPLDARPKTTASSAARSVIDSALEELNTPPRRPFHVQLSSDEEDYSRSSRPKYEKRTRAAASTDRKDRADMLSDTVFVESPANTVNGLYARKEDIEVMRVNGVRKPAKDNNEFEDFSPYEMIPSSGDSTNSSKGTSPRESTQKPPKKKKVPTATLR